MELKVNNLSFAYSDQKILDNLSLEIHDGEFVSILGPSGCGKSTLLNVLAGILTPQSGEIQIGSGKSAGVWRPGRETPGRGGFFAYMPQNDLLLPWKTVLDNVCLYGEIHRCKKQMKEKALRQLARFGLSGCENKYPDELSGGMRQRAAFLRTTLCEAEVFLLDEPFGALDVITRSDMQDWLRELCSSLKRTILLVTHDTDEAIYLSDRILVLGAPGEGIRSEIVIKEQNRTREWLYRQGELRAQIYRIIKEKKHD